VRHGRRIGLYVPYIYPSAWEPILLGREIYGFPKRLGKTIFWNRRDAEDTEIAQHSALSTQQLALLTVDGVEHFRVTWDAAEPSGEARLVRALSDWIGVEGRAAAAAFRAGDVLREALRLPAYRRVDVYNRKRVLAPHASYESPVYSVDCLTRATFGVLRWREITRLTDPALAVSGGPLLKAGLALRDAYFTRLDMRLSVGRIVHDYTR